MLGATAWNQFWKVSSRAAFPNKRHGKQNAASWYLLYSSQLLPSNHLDWKQRCLSAIWGLGYDSTWSRTGPFLRDVGLETGLGLETTTFSRSRSWSRSRTLAVSVLVSVSSLRGLGLDSSGLETSKLIVLEMLAVISIHINYYNN